MSITEFVRKTISEMNGFDKDHKEGIQEIIGMALEVYQLKSYEEVEETSSGKIRYLYIDSMMEENMLSKIVEVSTEGDPDWTIESVYDSRVIREY
ncbi:DUF6407 family protein [Falsibacillus pallidus]|uniref:Uncharacterized protein n=1 Tax=Falsibacillus pallidus TaxID=493781 RepID=A0A370GDT3_9BACI|nr:DUF6407 family protein [Falsibacillus pallidus]RDI41847.1 hypothetical protein DFR59_1066 [Falsibacillus pallidus]